MWIAKYLLLTSFLASALYVHFRGAVRHGLGRQLTDHSTFLAPVNVVMYAASKVPGRPFQSLDDFPQMRLLTQNWEAIRDEGRALMEAGSVRAADGYNDLGFNSFFRKGWKRFYLKWYDDALPSAERLCPRTTALLRQVPSVHGAMFALLPPGGTLVRHRDPFAGSMRYHLGLITPNSEDCFIEVDGIRRAWRDGEAMIFDETFIHHAENNADTTRLILFCDVERPLWGAIPRAYARWIGNHFVRATATQNEAGEKVGVANRVFGSVYRVRLIGKRLKKWNRRAYYAAKYAAVAGVVALLVLV